MKTYKQCLTCFERQAVNACEISELSSQETSVVMDAVSREIKTFPLDYPPIKMAVIIHNIVQSKSGIVDPYLKIKEESNRVCRECVPELMQVMNSSQSPLKTAVLLSIVGNIIDCGAYDMREIFKKKLMSVMHEVLEQSLQGDDISCFQELINNAQKILYIGDNAGECFFDRPLLDLLPAGKVVYAVRGGPVLNDALVVDALAAGIPDLCPVIDTGDNAPGVIMERCTDEFMHAFEDSDLIISKGQGNYESLSEVTDKIIVFLTKVKCEIIAQDIGYSLNSNVMKISRAGMTAGESLSQQC